MNTSPLKLHLGCGNKKIPGFVNIDSVNNPNVDKVCDVSKLYDFSNESVDLIYACHVLEHFKRADIERVLKEWNRVLKKKGLLRIAVPDFKSICEIYLKTKNIDLIEGPVVGRQNYPLNFHYTIFDYNKISQILSSNGFEEIRLYNWKNTEHSKIDDFSQAYIPHMDKKNGKLISLNVECKKK